MGLVPHLQDPRLTHIHNTYTYTLCIKESTVAVTNKCKTAIVNILVGQKLYGGTR